MVDNIKVLDVIKKIEEIGYNEETNLNFITLSHKHGKCVRFSIESIVDEKMYGDDDSITIEFNDNCIDVIKNMQPRILFSKNKEEVEKFQILDSTTIIDKYDLSKKELFKLLEKEKLTEEEKANFALYSNIFVSCT